MPPRISDEVATSPRVGVVTVLRGRHDHLRGQLWGLHRSRRPPDLHVVVAQDPDRAVAAGAEASTQWPTVVLPGPGGPDVPSLGALRHAGAAAAVEEGADVLVLLDGACIPGTDLVGSLSAVLGPRLRRGTPRPALACGIVRDLDSPTTALPAAHRDWGALDAGSGPRVPVLSRPAGAGRGEQGVRPPWAVAFAVTAPDWVALTAGDEGRPARGAEDPDIEQRLAELEGTVLWLGGATAYHQHDQPSPLAGSGSPAGTHGGRTGG